MKQSAFFYIFIFALLFPVIVPAQQIVGEESYVTFEVSNMKWNTVTGKLPGLTGTVKFDTDKPEQGRFEVRLSPKRINTGNNLRDKHLKKEDFFNTSDHPYITFTSESITHSMTGYQTSGNLSIKGITRRVTIPFSVEEQGNRLILTGYLDINRKTYDIGSNTGSFIIGKSVRADIRCVVKR